MLRMLLAQALDTAKSRASEQQNFTLDKSDLGLRQVGAKRQSVPVAVEREVQTGDQTTRWRQRR